MYNGYMKTVLNVKTDKEVKEKAQAVAKEIGLPLSTIVTRLLKDFIINKEVHFSMPYQMSSKLERKLAKVEKDIKAGKNMSPVLSTPEEIDAYLNSL